MEYGLQNGGPFHGLPCVKWTVGEKPTVSFSQAEFMAKLEKAAQMFGLGLGKRYLMVWVGRDTPKFDEVAPLIRLARLQHWFTVLYSSPSELPAVASEFDAVVANRFSKETTWLRYPCAGFVSGLGEEPEFDQATAGIPKYLFGASNPAQVFEFVKSAKFPWIVQSPLQFPEVVL